MRAELDMSMWGLPYPCQPHHPPGLRLAHLDAVRLKDTEIVVERDAALPILVQLNNNNQFISISLMGAAAALLAGIRKIQWIIWLLRYVEGDLGHTSYTDWLTDWMDESNLLKNPLYRPLLSLVFQLLGHLSSSHFSYLRGERGEEWLDPRERSQIRHLLPPAASPHLLPQLQPNHRTTFQLWVQPPPAGIISTSNIETTSVPPVSRVSYSILGGGGGQGPGALQIISAMIDSSTHNVANYNQQSATQTSGKDWVTICNVCKVGDMKYWWINLSTFRM